MTNSITNRQMFFILFLTLSTFTTIDLPKVMAQTAGRSSWVLILAAAVVFGLAAAIIAKLNNLFQGKVLFDYSQEVVGKFLARVIAGYYVLYFLVVGVYLKLKLVALMTSNFLPKTPQYLVLAVGIALFAYVAYKGITNVARMFEIIGVLFLIVTMVICLLMLRQGTVYNILPLISPNETKQFFGVAMNLIIPYGGIEVLSVIPFTQINSKAPKSAFLTLIFIGLFFVLILESTIMTLGINNTIAYNDSFIEAIKLVEFPIIERVDIFYLTLGLAGLFAGMMIVFVATVEYACRLFCQANRLIIVISIGVLFFILSLLGLNIKNMNDTFGSFLPYLILVSAILIPTTLLIAAKIKRRAK